MKREVGIFEQSMEDALERQTAEVWGQCELCGRYITEDEAEEIDGPWDDLIEVCPGCAVPWRS